MRRSTSVAVAPAFAQAARMRRCPNPACSPRWRRRTWSSTPTASPRPSRTATHIHQGATGKAGLLRLAFPNPEDTGGCMRGPLANGIMVNGADSGTGFTLDQIEANPAAFFTDSHTATFTAGAVRGQLTAVPMGGVEAGAGGTSGTGWAPTVLGAALLIGAAGVAARWRRAQV